MVTDGRLCDNHVVGDADDTICFFKQKTAYKMRISDWSSDVCSSDLCAQRIRDDQIDILIDLAGHSAGSRMRTMALGPAPVLVKWVGGLINTTGVESIDYLITDSIESPPDSDAP